MATPVNQGTLNRLRASVIFPDHPELNITPAFLGKEMLSISPQGDVTHIIPTATGVVTSPEPYQVVEVAAHVLRTNGLGDRFKKQMELLSTLGNCTVRGDTTVFSDYNLTNVSVKGVDTIRMNGEDAGWLIHLQGAYQINGSLYNL
jgi:hypothetical protein